MALVSVHSRWTVLLPGFVVAGLGIGLANPTIAGAALRVVDPSRTGMASGISNTCRVGGLAIGVAVLGAVLQHRVGDRLAAAGHGGKPLAAAVSSAGVRAVRTTRASSRSSRPHSSADSGLFSRSAASRCSRARSLLRA